MALSQYQQGAPSSGDFTPRIEYNAKAGRVYRPERRIQGPNGYETDKIEIPMPFGVAMDMANVEVGWALFEPGVAPNLVFVRLADVAARTVDYPAAPSDRHKEGFRVLVWNPEALGPEPREFSSVARAVREQFDVLHDHYTAAKDDHPGKAPWVVFAGVSAITGQHGTNYAPTLQITDWVDATMFPTAAATPATAPAPVAPAIAPPPGPGPAPVAVAPPPAPVAAPPVPPLAPPPPSSPAVANPAAPEFGPPPGV